MLSRVLFVTVLFVQILMQTETIFAFRESHESRRLDE